MTDLSAERREWLTALIGPHRFADKGDGCRCRMPEDDPIHVPVAIGPDGYAVQWESGLEYLSNLGGVSWCEAPVPPRRHTCWPQTKGYFARSGPVCRCACGAISRGDRDWWDRNTRRRDEPPAPWWRRVLNRLSRRDAP